jgi:hypothetical protein
LRIQPTMSLNEKYPWNKMIVQHADGNEINCDTFECFASTAKLLCPKKRAKVEDLSIQSQLVTSKTSTQIDWK